MKKYIYTATIFFLLILSSCSEKNESSQNIFEADKNALLKSIDILGKAADKMNKISATESEININNIADNSQVSKLTEQQQSYLEALEEIESGIKESYKVSDNFLNNIHPEMKTMYRDNYIGSFKLVLTEQKAILKKGFDKGTDILKDKDYLTKLSEEHAKSEKHILEMQTLWYNFIQSHQDVLNDEINLSGKKSNKSYWGMFWRFLIATFIAVILVSVVISLLVLPIAGLGLIGDKIKSNVLPYLNILFSLIAGIAQFYFWLLWAAFCVHHIYYFMDSPNVTHRWLYYITGFSFAITPMSYLSSKEQDITDSHKEKASIFLGSSIYILFTVVMFILFCIYPNWMDYKYVSFINDWLTKH
ncbi:hypothetical protein [Flavobacterium sp.]|uniref:hypothetical protein n=1 Tax=Flavobacterium sp. TaxID=239 RepID=UPI0025FE1E6D|nr:hypothetical protein [Flavobacterium sp.]